MDYREISRLKSDLDAVRTRSAFLLSSQPDLSAEQRDFLGSLAHWPTGKDLSTRQAEFLQSLYQRTHRKRVVSGVPVASTVQKLWEARDDLDEDHVEELSKMRDRGPDLAVSEAQWRMLCAMQRAIWPDFAFVPFT